MDNNSVKNELLKDAGTTRGIAISILSMFESVLDSHKIKIPDVDREGNDEEACIYGKTYFALEDKIYELLCDYIDE